MLRAQCSLVRTRCSDAHLPLGLSVIHLAYWCPSRSFTYYPHLYLTWQLAGTCLRKISSPVPIPHCQLSLLSLPPVEDSLYPLQGALPKTQGSQTPPDVGAFPEASVAQLRPQPPCRHHQSTQLCLSELGWESRSVSHPASHCAHAAGFRPCAELPLELQAAAQVAVTLSSLCLDLSQLLPSWARLRNRRDESQEESARRYRCTPWAPGLSEANSSNARALCLESGSIRLVFLPILVTALTTMNHWTCTGAHQWKGNTGELLCQQPIAWAQVGSYLADKSSPLSKLPLRGG